MTSSDLYLADDDLVWPKFIWFICYIMRRWFSLGLWMTSCDLYLASDDLAWPIFSQWIDWCMARLITDSLCCWCGGQTTNHSAMLRQTAVNIYFTSKQLPLFVFELRDSLLPSSTGILSAEQRQTAITAHFTSKHLQLFAFALPSDDTRYGAAWLPSLLISHVQRWLIWFGCSAPNCTNAHIVYFCLC